MVSREDMLGMTGFSKLVCKLSLKCYECYFSYNKGRNPLIEILHEHVLSSKQGDKDCSDNARRLFEYKPSSASTIMLNFCRAKNVEFSDTFLCDMLCLLIKELHMQNSQQRILKKAKSPDIIVIY